MQTTTEDRQTAERVLLVEHDERYRRAIVEVMRSRGYEVEAAPDPDDALEILPTWTARHRTRTSGRIAQSAEDLGDEGRDVIYGRGRINVARALGL